MSEESNDPITPAIYQTSNFRFRDVDSFRVAMADEEHGLIYSRGNNPTLNTLADKLGALEGGKALLFSSGMGAISTAILSVARTGRHALCIEGAYSWTDKIFREILPHYGVDAEIVPGAEIIDHIRKDTNLVYIESPLTKTFELLDIKAVCDAAHSVGAVVMLDNSYSTPLLQRPLEMGVDFVLHSATKYIGGHSDTVGGVVVCREEMYSQLFNNEYLAIGAIMSPFNAWLFLRGLRTLPVRLERISDSAEKVIAFFENCSEVEAVLYPGSHSPEQKKLFSQQMSGISGLFSVVFKNKSPEFMKRFCNSLQHFQMAVSWGGHESLVLPYSLWQNSENSGMARFSIGVERPETLIKDIEQALSAADK
ncbi:L-methionine gamma-lyase [bioreactor metagenome]|uniref:L-methionine gamma-lyase n=1 Tax=bioreactor metagenome TaxID=1076179 RepID=A0A644W7A8_9ZZZZ